MVSEAIPSQFSDEIGFHFMGWQWQLVIAVFLCPVCDQCKCYQNKIYFRSFFRVLVFGFKLGGYPQLSINFSPFLPLGVCTYLIWTVFISSGPDAFGQPFIMRSSLDI